MATYSLLECPLAARDYAYYKAKFAEVQAQDDELCDEFGLPKVDRAYVKTLERAQWRALKASGVTFGSSVARFHENSAVAEYAEALGVAL
jgi:hypothetical protein